MTKEEQIQESIRNSTENYRKKKQAAKERQQYLKRGIAVVRDKEISVYKVELYNKFKLAIGIIKVNHNLIYFTWAACSPKDTWSNRIAKGLIGNRINNGGCFCLFEYDKSVVQLAYEYIIDRAINGTEFEQSNLPAMSQRLIKSLKNEPKDLLSTDKEYLISNITLIH